jgi:hypothetical protein
MLQNLKTLILSIQYIYVLLEFSQQIAIISLNFITRFAFVAEM